MLDTEFEDEPRQTIQRLYAMRGVALQQQAQKRGERSATAGQTAEPRPRPAAERKSATILHHPAARAGTVKVTGSATAGRD